MALMLTMACFGNSNSSALEYFVLSPPTGWRLRDDAMGTNDEWGRLIDVYLLSSSLLISDLTRNSGVFYF